MPGNIYAAYFSSEFTSYGYYWVLYYYCWVDLVVLTPFLLLGVVIFISAAAILGGSRFLLFEDIQSSISGLASGYKHFFLFIGSITVCQLLIAELYSSMVISCEISLSNLGFIADLLVLSSPILLFSALFAYRLISVDSLEICQFAQLRGMPLLILSPTTFCLMSLVRLGSKDSSRSSSSIILSIMVSSPIEILSRLD